MAIVLPVHIEKLLRALAKASNKSVSRVTTEILDQALYGTDNKREKAS